jgi:hypothetical protein
MLLCLFVPGRLIEVLYPLSSSLNHVVAAGFKKNCVNKGSNALACFVSIISIIAATLPIPNTASVKVLPW